MVAKDWDRGIDAKGQVNFFEVMEMVYVFLVPSTLHLVEDNMAHTFETMLGCHMMFRSWDLDCISHHECRVDILWIEWIVSVP